MKDKLDGTAQKAKRVSLHPLSLSSYAPHPAFPSPLLMSLFVVSLTTVLVTLRPKRRKLRDIRRLMKYARLLSARPNEAADKGSEKAHH